MLTAEEEERLGFVVRFPPTKLKSVATKIPSGTVRTAHPTFVATAHAGRRVRRAHQF